MIHQSDIDCKIIIPARYESSRFEGKPLEQILGVPMIKRVWLQCIKAISKKDVYIATDDQRILSYCLGEGMQAVLTSKNCLTGTDRIYEASKKIKADIYINVQGDEPLINPDDIQKVITVSKQNPQVIYNAMCKISSEVDFRSTAIPKVVSDLDDNLLYMSRAAIPTSKDNEFKNAFRQICIYAFPKKLLGEFAKKACKTPIENIEDIEILRFLEMGIPVKMIEVSESSIAVDYPEDIERVEYAIQRNQE
jgi:3-deoxy-manno-octulosonate cytidylyltransferase (CMP-KDO synthetase)